MQTYCRAAGLVSYNYSIATYVCNYVYIYACKCNHHEHSTVVSDLFYIVIATSWWSCSLSVKDIVNLVVHVLVKANITFANIITVTVNVHLSTYLQVFTHS